MYQDRPTSRSPVGVERAPSLCEHREVSALGPLVTPSLALARPPGTAYAACLREIAVPIDVELAALQHAAYVDALGDAGIRVVLLPELAGAPDAVFVEDTAVVLDTCAVITRPGAPSRRVEVASIAAVLAEHRTLHTMVPPATLDGGDVLRVGRRLLVGLSQRTNREGLAMLAGVAAIDGLEVVAVAVRGGLHLKSACSLARADLLLVRGDQLDAGPLRRLGIGCLEVPEDAGANVLGFTDRVLVSAAAPRTTELLAGHGLRPVLLELSQIHAGDGALTCMSLRLGARPAWVA